MFKKTMVRGLMAAVALRAMLGGTALSDTIFSNDLETDTHGFAVDPSGDLTSLSRVLLPTDDAGPSSPNQSHWLGEIGAGVPKSPTGYEKVDLPLTGLVPGQVYTVAFDLLIGASWDGSAGAPYGPDTWYFSANGTRLVDATFSNLQLNYNAGAYSPQTYSVAHHTNPATDPLVPNFTGAAAFYSVPGSDYAVDYSIYYFSHGTGNPVLQFTATGSSALLQFARYGNTYDSSDEYWALDNVVVTGQAVPEPTAFTLLASAGLSTAVVALVRRRRHRVAGLRVVKAA